MKYTFVIILSLISSYSLAQNLYISTGVTRSGMSIIHDDDYDGRRNFKEISPGFTINLLYEIKLGNHVALKTGPCLLSKSGGYKFTYIDIDGPLVNGVNRRINKNRSIEFSYLSIDFPLLLTYNFIDPGKKIIINLNAGPYLGRFMPSTFFITRSDAPGLIWSDSFNKFDYGFYMSAGIGFRKWQLSCFMSKGLRNISNSVGLYANIISAKTNVTGISVTRVLNLTKEEPKSQ